MVSRVCKNHSLHLLPARLEELAYRSVPARIAAVLLHLAREQHHAIPITHQELGEMVGVLRETVTSVLGEFQRAGLVQLQRGQIRVSDQEGLLQQLEE